ncbi:MAG: efflux RND transporter periplasmic adaptor subunit [Candidatus Gastranaerophilales bacterium]|nr:efflux RND transporter periplasmic adaptor subunit [Candidatus Gastranaerophilales bacterium]
MNIKNPKVIAVSVVCIAIVAIGGFLSAQKQPKFETKPLETCTITEVVEASGTINPVNTVSVGSTVSGLIKGIYVDFNSEVKKGQILAQIDPANFEATVAQNEASIANSKANLIKLQATAEMSRKTYTRYKNLYSRNFVAKSELDQAESDYKASMAQISAARAQIRQNQAQYQTAMTNLGYTRIVAPVDGTVISRKIDVGQPVAASFQAPELFTIAQDLKKMQIEVNVSEADISKVKVGQEVKYTLDGYPDSEFTGKVSQVRLSATTVSNVVTYPVIVEVNNDDLKLVPGMTANVSIITSKSENVLCAPNNALKFTMDAEQKYKEQGLWILVKNKPERFNIKTGTSNDSVTEVISKELKSGMQVILEQKNKKGEKMAHDISSSRGGSKSGKSPMRMF